MKVKKYQPSNGSEHICFTETYCMNCVNCDPDPEGPKQCDIILKTFYLNGDEDDYPSELTYDKNDNPICTSFKFWDWEKLGNPDIKKKIEIIDPNQINLL